MRRDKHTSFGTTSHNKIRQETKIRSCKLLATDPSFHAPLPHPCARFYSARGICTGGLALGTAIAAPVKHNAACSSVTIFLRSILFFSNFNSPPPIKLRLLKQVDVVRQALSLVVQELVVGFLERP